MVEKDEMAAQLTLSFAMSPCQIPNKHLEVQGNCERNSPEMVRTYFKFLPFTHSLNNFHEDKDLVLNVADLQIYSMFLSMIKMSS